MATTVESTSVPKPENATVCDVGLHSPPDSNQAKPESDSELSDIDEDDLGEIEPDHYADEGRVPVFKPTMEVFKDFQKYMKKINHYGMQSGIVKVIPPPEWHASLPSLDEAVKAIRVKEPIKQDIMGTSGTYRQANILHQRSYNLPQWRQLCEQSEHQPPAKRGERRANQERVTRSTPKSRITTSNSATQKHRGRPRRGTKAKAPRAEDMNETQDEQDTPDRLPTPISPKEEEFVKSIKAEADEDDVSRTRGTPIRLGGRRGGGRMGGGARQPKPTSVSQRRKYNRREATAKIDEAAFKDFNYRLDTDEYTQDRCEELERAYWKTLTYASPLYGADMPGTLFDERTTSWNLGRLENLLDVIGTHIPGVNTAYLYLGMWKATFAWHLEDVDLYSINYLHFGAPKQWYSISQRDARRFEAAMKSVWPADAKACDQFLRHKTFLISPANLLQNYNIKVNKIVSHPGEFVITFPYGYHSGYNLGYNCAEAVNFALDSWLEYGRVAKRCDCDQAQDSVWIDVHEIERKLRGEETEYDETDDEGEDDDDEQGVRDLPTPPESAGDVKPNASRKKRKRHTSDKGDKSNLKRIRLRIKGPAREPCMLCPNDIPSEPLLPTEDGQKAHRLCALYIPETFVDDSGAVDTITDVQYIDKARLGLKCNYCRSKKGACFQCSQKKCTRSYHPTCAAAAGVFVEQGEMPVFGEDGTEYKEPVIEFSCRFHRSKRDKKYEGGALEENERIRKIASKLRVDDICQIQFYKGDVFAGAVVENRKSEETVLVNVLPRGDCVEVEYKWIVVPEPSDYHIPKPSANAIPLPKSRKEKLSLNTTKRLADDLPRAEDPFVQGSTWSEFKTVMLSQNSVQVKIDFSKDNQIWYYLGKTSTEARAQFTEDPLNPRNNPSGHFLDSIPKIAKVTSYSASYPKTNLPGSVTARPIQSLGSAKDERPYEYKPRVHEYRVDSQAPRIQQSFVQKPTPYSFGTDPRWQGNGKTGNNGGYSTTPRVSQPTTKPNMAPPPTSHYRSAPGHPPTPTNSSRSQQSTKQLATPSKAKCRFNMSNVSPFAKYPYLHIEHNRSPLDYKSPYRPGGGFMNGYQGSEDSFRKHAEQSLLDKKPSTGYVTSSLTTNTNTGHGHASLSKAAIAHNSTMSTNHIGYGAPVQTIQNTQPSSSPSFYRGNGIPLSTSESPRNSAWNRSEVDMHSAVRKDFNPLFHQQYQPLYHAQTNSYRRASNQEHYESRPSTPQKSYEMAPPLQPGYPYSASQYSSHSYSRPCNEQSRPTSAQAFRQMQYNYPLAQTPQTAGLKSPSQSQYGRSLGQQAEPSSPAPQAQQLPTNAQQSQPSASPQEPSLVHRQYASNQQSRSDQSYQVNGVYLQENNLLYAHQQYYPKFSISTPTSKSPPLQTPYQTPPLQSYKTQLPSQTHHPQIYRPRPPDLPEVPGDSSSLIESMMANLRKAAGSA